jgi:hypothetical protein
MSKKLLIMALMICSIYLAGCQAPTTEIGTTAPVIEPVEPAPSVIEPAPTPEPSTPTTGDEATDIESEISDAGTLDEDLDLSDLDGIDEELDDISW